MQSLHPQHQNPCRFFVPCPIYPKPATGISGPNLNPKPETPWTNPKSHSSLALDPFFKKVPGCTFQSPGHPTSSCWGLGFGDLGVHPEIPNSIPDLPKTLNPKTLKPIIPKAKYKRPRPALGPDRSPIPGAASRGSSKGGEPSAHVSWAALRGYLCIPNPKPLSLC